MAAVLAVLRGAAGMSQLEFGQLLGWSQSVVTKIERRQRRTFHDIAEVLRVCDLLGMPRDALLPLVLGDADAMLGNDEEVMFWEVGIGVDRRQFNHLALGTAVAALVSAPDHVDRGHVRYLQSCLEKLRDRDRAAGDGRQLSQALRLYQRARQMLDESDYCEAVGHELVTVTAEVGNMAGWLAYDSGQQNLARTLYIEAAQLADSGGVPELQAYVYANLAQQSVHLAWPDQQRGRAREALRFADRAADCARHLPSPRLHALIALRRSLAHVRLDDAPAYRSSINVARRELDRLGHCSNDPAWASFVSPSEITGFEAMGAERLGSPGRAAELYRSVAEDLARSPRDRAYYRACLAGALCAEGDTTTAVSQALTVLPSPGEPTGSMRTLRQLRPLRNALGPSEEEFCVRFDAAVRVLTAASA